MKRYLLGSALLLACTALAQTAQAQTPSEYEARKIGLLPFVPVCVHDEPTYDDAGDVTYEGGWFCNDLKTEPDEIIIVGRRLGVARLDELTSPATVVSDDQLRARNQGELADALRSVPGLSVNASGPSTGLTQLRLRGAEANQVVVLIDGVEVANPADGAFDFGGLRSEDIVRVEVLRGEQSALYGSDAVAGVINIITGATSARERWAASVEYGTRDTLEGQLSAGIPVGDAVLSVTGNAFETDGYNVSGGDGENDGASSRAIHFGLNGVDVGAFALSGRYGFTRRDVEFDEDSDFDGRLNDTDSESTVETQTARLEARAELGGLNWLAAVSRLETETDTRAGFSTETTGTREQVTLVAEKEIGAHNLTALGEYEREAYEFAGDPDTPSNDTWGVAGDYRYGGDALTLTASARIDANDLFDDSVTWRVGTGYATPVGRFTASGGTAVKTPTLIELFGFFPQSSFVGNADLQPEESLGYNIGWSLDLGDGRVAANYFRSELEDEIITVFNPDFTTGVANLDTDSTREGVELEGDYRVGPVTLRASASFLESDQNGVEEIRRPDLLASGSVDWEVNDVISATIFADHTGEQLDTDFATFSDVELDSFTLVGANLRYRATENWGVYLRGENLLDEDYEEVVGYRSPGRALIVGLRADY